jgi:hypothetical protein
MSQKQQASALMSSLKDGKCSPGALQTTLSQLKVLGRDSNNVSRIYDHDGIAVLGRYAFGEQPASVQLEASRCLANALLLLPATRKHAIDTSLDEKAAKTLLDAGDDAEFVLSRILFLMTYDPGIDLEALIKEHGLADSINTQIRRHAEQARATAQKPSTDPSNMAMMETLKLLFNVTNAKPARNEHFKPCMQQVLRLFSEAKVPSPPLQPPISLMINALANLEIDTDIAKSKEAPEVVDKLIYTLAQAVREHKANELENVAIPLLTVLRHYNQAGPLLRRAMKTRILPSYEERDQPLGKSSSLASQLLRLTTTSGLLNLTEAISGLMFELSDKDAGEYVKNVGYGYAAGYLMTHKIPIPDSARTGTGAVEGDNDTPINPITGQRLDREPPVRVPNMTQAEKEREAERLFVLFERLKATGVANVKNPVELARDQGRFEELSDSDRD